MKQLNRLFTLLAATLIFAACGEDRTYEYYKLTEENQWIFSRMQESYLWGDTLKQPARNKFFAKSSDFFYSLIQRGDKASHFTDSATLTSYGLTFGIVRDPLGIKPGKSYAAVLFVEKGSPAEAAGLKRGMWLTSIGNKNITTSNYGYLERGEATTVCTARIIPDTVDGAFIWSADDTLNIPKAVRLDPSALILDSIYYIPDHKVGYIICNRFDESKSLAPTLAHFASEGVTDLIIDLRYCSGGALQAAASLASAIVPEAAGDTFCSLIYNSSNSDKESRYTLPTPPTILHPWHTYIITTNATRGTAEAFTAAVKYYLGDDKVTLIGQPTAGDNLHTQSIESPYNFTINPAVAAICTPDGNILSSDGLTVDYQVNELQGNKILELGNTNETMLYSALYHILHGTTPYEIPEPESVTNIFQTRYKSIVTK